MKLKGLRGEAKIRKPESMEECLYFTRRTIDNGKIMAWAMKIDCPECGKALMGKPKGPDGKTKIRAKECVCPECGHTEEKEEHEAKLELGVEYTCPFCGNSGETTTEYKRKSYRGVKAYVFTCDKCGEKIGISKKMKEFKK